MKGNLGDRYKNAFGFVAANMSTTLTDNGFEEEIQQPQNTQVFLLDNKTKFDEVKLYRDKIEFDFAFRQIAEEYNTVYATPPMLSFSRQKKLIVTAIDNVDDIEIVERYNTSPYDIDWKGLLIDMENHSFPADKLKQLNQIFKHNGIWNVSSEIFDALEITAIYIQDVQIDFVEGFEDTIAYSFKMRAIKDLEYQILTQDKF
ncbi:DUF6046 domain-containing protein [Flavobacterium sp. LS1R49]|uniref:DUF6046 domain-containing protein n=1 Tax=Flavobacterium shii TaxID=2987687 RepID=A0A9X2ZHM3_9FLAO|nr:DUF6046 domain-containing protein [Flavobacterium shii]MCV9929520.1 DUF6046 domain-containing protein [Flavobacterium shii]